MMEYYTDTQENVLICATMWMNFEDIVLCEMSQIQKDKYSMTLRTEVPGAVKFIAIEIEMVVTRGWGGGKGRELYLMGKELQSCKMKRVLKMMVVMAAQHS